jgi:NitT/TauT family transport system substrate-binding protein
MTVYRVGAASGRLERAEVKAMTRRYFTAGRAAIGGLVLTLLSLILGSPSRGQETKSTVRLHIPGYSPNSLPFQIAEDKGFYKQEGITVQTVRMKTGAGVQAMLAENVDVSQILGLTLRAAISRGAPVKIVMIFNDRVLYRLLAKNQIKGFPDLKGKTIASTTPGASNDVLLKRVLEKHGLDARKDLTVVYIGESITLYQALTRGSVEAAVLNPPYNVLAKEAGFRELAEFANEIGALQGGISMAEKLLKERPEVARGFIRATWKGLRFFRSDREGTIPILTKYMKVEREIGEKIYDGSVDSFTDTGFISEDFQRKVLEFEFEKADKAMMQKAFDFSVVANLK